MADPLVAALDEGAKKLLEMAMADSRNADGTPNVTTLAERVKAFDSVATWVQTRLKINPPKQERSRFDELRDDFNGIAPPPERGRTARKSAKKADGDTAPPGELINGADFLA